MNTHYGVVMFSGDPGNEHPDDELRGHGPQMTFICTGPEEFCWATLTAWTTNHPLRQWEDAEVLTRHPSVVRAAPSVDLGGKAE